MSYIRLRNRLLQAFYRPFSAQRKGLFSLPSETLSIFDELDKRIEENISPLFSELFGG
ncbi:MAG: hypothetical protein FWG87_00240 [Defluviitaleaceae bacterium]|nr:hypothetical protein [Defluviitaleaceae bacterium]